MTYCTKSRLMLLQKLFISNFLRMQSDALEPMKMVSFKFSILKEFLIEKNLKKRDKTERLYFGAGKESRWYDLT